MSTLSNSLLALAYLLGAAAVTYPLVALTIRQSHSQNRNKGGRH